MTSRVSSKGQIVLPVELRRRDDIRPGQEFEIERIAQDEYRLRRVSSPTNAGLVDWLLECPQKGFFVAVASESTDEL